LDGGYKNTIKCLFHNTVLSYYQLYDNNGRVAFLIFYRKPLLHYLYQAEVWKIMEESEYKKDNLSLIMKEFETRYKRYVDTRETFPHELGLLLGYPPEDVREFIQHKGGNYLFSGYWKVYSNVDNAKKVFEQYEKAKKLMLTWVLQGGSVRSILTFRQEVNKKYRNYSKIIKTKRRSISYSSAYQYCEAFYDSKTREFHAPK
jgi:hypothetical protein